MRGIVKAEPVVGRPLPQEIDEMPVAYLEVDSEGCVSRANRAALALHHPDQGDLIGMNVWKLMAADEKDSSHADYKGHMETGEDPTVTSRSLFDRSGRFRTYELHRSLMHDADGKPAGMRIVLIDVSDARAELEEAQRKQQWLENAMTSLPNAIFLTDILGVVRGMNPAAEELSGYAAHELIGKTIDGSMPVLTYHSADGTHLSRHAAIETHCQGIATILNRGREEVKVEMNTSPILDRASGAVSGVAAILRRIPEDA